MATDDLVEYKVDRFAVLTGPEGALELYRSDRGELILWAYSSQGKLVVSCGDGQPYVRASAEDLGKFARNLNETLLVALDAWHPDGARYPAPDVSELDPLGYVGVPDETISAGVVWVPTRPVRQGDQLVAAELHCREPGRPLLLAYSSLEALVNGCGPYQAAAAIHVDRLDDVASQAGACGVALNVSLTEDSRHTAPVRDWSRHTLFDVD
ncbi:SAV_915 family protein [Amycolatopsis sp. NPDC049868]|uniref:SAV_915 family protein n=1 Tax=Amycolatopsis sp. NPDC049868 TaxID=3363934 RepID=UPI0037AE7D79